MFIEVLKSNDRGICSICFSSVYEQDDQPFAKFQFFVEQTNTEHSHVSSSLTEQTVCIVNETVDFFLFVSQHKRCSTP